MTASGRPVLWLHESNRMERLAEALGDVVAVPQDDPLASECLVVPGRALSHWLSLTLCQRFGVWSNALYLYPKNFVQFALERVLGAPGEAVSRFEEEELFWSVLTCLRPLLDESAFEPIRRYVSDDASQTRYFSLCQKIARTFDRYLTYRPDFLKTWERRGAHRPSGASQLPLFDGSEPTADWQPVLWRALIERLGKVHHAALERRFLKRLAREGRPENLPSRICCFGITSLPPSYATILVALCRHVPVHLFQLRASPESGTSASKPRDREHDNPLLASTERLATEFDEVLARELAVQGVTVERESLHELPDASTRLSRLQRDMAERRPPGVDASQADDDSVRLHVCHGPMREVEVLHDQLMALLAHGSGLEPEDVVVMMPDVERYAPLVEAVFRRHADAAYRIPFCIADRAVHAAAPVVDGLRRLLSLVDQRLSAPQVLDLLSLEVVAARFDITARDLETVADMLRRSNVRWGIDGAHRKAHGHPESDANTWREGLRRLLLGYAVESERPKLLLNVLPAGGLEGSRAQLLGKLCDFIETLTEHLAALTRPQTPRDWQRSVGAALEALFLADSQTDWQHQQVRTALDQIVARATAAEFEGTVTSPALSSVLFDGIAAAHPARGFMSGGVTFCSMVPLRTVPFRVVCLIGMSDDQFPRSEHPPDFDRMAHDPSGPRPGDRSRRTDDRYLFLEALLSARERLIVTYTGQSIRDNAPIPPSVLVAELCDYLSTGWSDRASSPPGSSADAPGSDSWIVKHPLQAFSSRYFDGKTPGLFSYEASYVPHRAVVTGGGPASFFSRPLTAPPVSDVSLEDLVRFFQNPTAFLFRRRLGVSLRDIELEIPEREPLELSPLERYHVGQFYLDARLAGASEREADELARATRWLPQGGLGQIELSLTASVARPIARQVGALLQDAPPCSRRVSVPLSADRRLVGHLDGISKAGRVEVQFARIHAKHLLGLWIHHLVLCVEPRDDWTAQSSIVGRSERGAGVSHFRFPVVPRPLGRLEALCQLYDEGQQRPLHFFPEASLAYARALRDKSDRPQAAREAARRAWATELATDLHLQRAHGTRSSLPDGAPSDSPASGDEFARLSLDVLSPLLEHLKEVE